MERNLFDWLQLVVLNLTPLVVCVSLPGGAIPTGVSSVSAVSHNQPAPGTGGDRYAALVELDTVFGPPAPTSGLYNNSSSTQG